MAQPLAGRVDFRSEASSSEYEHKSPTRKGRNHEKHFGFWILNFGLVEFCFSRFSCFKIPHQTAAYIQSKIANPKSKITEYVNR